MNRHYAYYAPQKYNMKKLYIVTRPTRRTDLELDDDIDPVGTGDGDDNADWRDKARRLQLRRWRKIKHQLV
jgi:hypothetical protein